MSAVQEVVNTGLDNGPGSLSAGMIGLGALGATMASAKMLTNVPEGYVGFRTRFDSPVKLNGELSKVIQAGRWPHFTAPFTHSIVKVSIKDRPNDLEDIWIDDDKNHQLLVRSSIAWGVRPDGSNPQKSVYRVEDGDTGLSQVVTNIVVGGIRTVTNGRSREELDDVREITGNLKEECRDDLLYYGTELRRLNIKTISETPGEKMKQGGYRIITSMDGSSNGHSLNGNGSIDTGSVLPASV